MDTEAKIILDDTISFCERDERDGRLINILGQCVPVELTETSLTIEAPTRFAYSYLLKQRAIIERYLEEITFGPLALNVTVPESITAGHRGVADPSPRRDETAPAPAVVSRETYEQAEAAAPAGSDAGVHAGASGDTVAFTGAPSHGDETVTSEAHEAHRLSLGTPAEGGEGQGHERTLPRCVPPAHFSRPCKRAETGRSCQEEGGTHTGFPRTRSAVGTRALEVHVRELRVRR